MSFLLGWLWDLLYALGFYKKEATILLLGLDNAGKTTLLHKLRHGSVRLFIPTQRPSLEEITLGNVNFKAWDLGGHKQVRVWWRDYFFEADAIVFVVDSVDQDRLPEAKEELQGLLAEENLSDVKAFVVLGNKTDLPGALSREQLISALGLNEVVEDQTRKLEVFRSSLVDGTGYLEAFKWLGAAL
ncbi:intracellular protein transport [Balamuthia mandrillaris]